MVCWDEQSKVKLQKLNDHFLKMTWCSTWGNLIRWTRCDIKFRPYKYSQFLTFRLYNILMSFETRKFARDLSIATAVIEIRRCYMAQIRAVDVSHDILWWFEHWSSSTWSTHRIMYTDRSFTNERAVCLLAGISFLYTLATGDCAQIVQLIILIYFDCLVVKFGSLLIVLRQDLSKS